MTQYRGVNSSSIVNKIKYASIAIVGIIFVSALIGSWYTIDQGERGVILRNGKIVGSAAPGLGFKIPFIDDIVRISTQTHTVKYENIEAYSRDQQTAGLRASVTFSVPVDMVENVYEDFKSVEQMVSRLLDRQVPTQVENIFGQFTAISAVQDRVKFGQDISEAIKQSIEKVNKDGKSAPILIQSVQIENINFSKAYELNIETRMKAEVEVQTQLQNLEKERVSAQITVTAAQAQADSQLALATAEAKAIRLKGEAEASAIKSRAEALENNENLVDLTKAERWNGVLPTTMLPNSAVPFIEANKK